MDTQTQSFFQEQIRFGLKGEINEVKALKCYLSQNPQASLYITERQNEDNPKQTNKYLEVRQKEGGSEKLIIQIKVGKSQLIDNYPALVISKETISEGQEQFCQVSKGQRLTEIMALERVSSKKDNSDDEDGEDQFLISSSMRITKDKLMSEEQRLKNELKQQQMENQEEESDCYYINDFNRFEFKKRLENYIKANDKNDLSFIKIKNGIKIRPINELQHMLEELCYKQQTQKNSIVYKLKSK